MKKLSEANTKIIILLELNGKKIIKKKKYIQFFIKYFLYKISRFERKK